MTTNKDKAVQPPEAPISARVTQAAHEAIDCIGQRSAEAEEKLRAAREQASSRGEEVTAQIAAYVKENPLTALGIAAAAGFVLGSLLRR